ncbi:hypothetical protein C8R47DRAFT_1290292 [Mycena vitilis]|nr:hypothetical protein C8R47DRAFT_1290292 [Mycena vitilis]
MSNSTIAAQASHVVDGAFLRLWGVQYVTYTLDVGFWAVAMLIVFQYFQKYSKKDPLPTRITVAILGTFTTIHTLSLAMQDFRYYVLRFGNFEGLDSMFWESYVMICSIFVVAFVAQMFYASRIWMLKRDWRYVTPVVLLALLQLSFGIAQTAKIVGLHRYSKLATTVPTTAAQGAATAACDITITAILGYIFRAARTGVRRTDSTLDKMILYAFERGTMTSLLALLQLIFFITMPGTFVFTVFLFPSSHVYVISVCGMCIPVYFCHRKTVLRYPRLTSRQRLGAQLRNREGIIGLRSMGTNSVHTPASENLGVHVTKSVIKWVGNEVSESENWYTGSFLHLEVQ